MVTSPGKVSGFTLVELIVVIILVSILALIIPAIIQGPMRAYVQVQQRADLVEAGETALHRMTREIRLALPNSVRVNGNNAVEILRTLDGGRYRRLPAPGPSGNVLDFTSQTGTFDYLGPLDNLGDIDVSGAVAGQGECFDDTVDCLVIYNTGQGGANAYLGNNIAALTAKTAATLSFDLSPRPRFPFESPRQRFYVVDTPVSFICDSGAGEIRRYSGYTFGPVQPSAASPPPGGNLLIDRVAACNFTYNPGTESRAGMVTLSITMTDAALGESVSLLQQVHVPNQP